MIRRDISRPPTRSCCSFVGRLVAVLIVVFLDRSSLTNFAVAQPPAASKTEPSPAADSNAARSFDRTVRVDEIEAETRVLLDRSEQLIAQKRVEQAIELWRGLIDSDGDRLVARPTDSSAKVASVIYIPLRDYLRLRIADLHASDPRATQAYRATLDAQVQRWLKAPGSLNDETILRRIVEQAFFARRTDECIWRLSERAMERGEYATARVWLKHLIDPAEVPIFSQSRGEEAKDPRSIQVPSPSWSPRVISSQYASADVAARLVLISIIEGDQQRAEWELTWFRDRYPDAQGAISGKQGSWAELLDRWLQAARSWPPRRDPPDWPVWGGNNHRTRIARGPVDPSWKAAWSVKLPRMSLKGQSDDDHTSSQHQSSALEAVTSEIAAASSAPATRIYPYHPIVVAGRVFLSSPRGIHGWDLRSGQPLVEGGDSHSAAGLIWESTLADETDAKPREQTRDPTFVRPRGTEAFSVRVSGKPAYLASSTANLLIAKTGLPWLVGGEQTSAAAGNAPANQLVAIDLAAEGRVAWRQDGRDVSSTPNDDSSAGTKVWTWDGPPVIHDGRLYQGFRQSDGVQTELFVVCLELSSGRLLWKRAIVSADFSRIRSRRQWTNNLLTLQENMLYYNTNAGVIAALECEQGQLRWLLRYPAATLDTTGLDRPLGGRDLNPCLVDRDRIIVAPADSHQLFAIDSSSGQILWGTAEEETADVTHLLGIAAGRIIASGRCLQWFDAETGASRGRFPAVASEQPLAGTPAPVGAGRGVLVDQQVWWPTRDQIDVFDQQTTRQDGVWKPRAIQRIDLRSRGIVGGNLVIADGVLIIAGPDTLQVFPTP